MFAGSALLTLQWTPPCGVIRATHHRVPNTENEFDSNFSVPLCALQSVCLNCLLEFKLRTSD